MEKKYYDLIVSLIKEHRKYPGCEEILDAIAEDVYSHSKVVIDSITNEDVLNSYFKKVISTSIVTVPKKLNVRTRSSRQISSILLEASTTEVVTEKTSKLIDSPEDILPIENIETNDGIEETDTGKLESFVEGFSEETEENSENFVTELPEDGETELIEDELLEGLNLTEESDVLDIDNIETESVVATAEFEQEKTFSDQIDKSLVDKMINGIASTEINPSENSETVNSEEISVEEDLLESFDNGLDDLVQEPTASEELEALDEELTVESEAEAEELETFEEELTVETEAEVEELEALDEELAVEPEAEVEELEALDEELAVEPEAEVEELETFEEELTVEPEAEVEEVEASAEFTPPTYDCFDFEPELQDVDIAEIFSYLETIDNKYPEKQILRICDLKYNKKLSIKEIAATLERTEEDIIMIIYEIIESVKE